MFNTKLFLYLISFIALFALWQILSFWIGSEVLPPPIPVVLAFVVELTKSNFWQNTYSSLFRILGGLGLAFITAVPLGLILGSFPKLDKWFSPIIYMSYPIPKIILLIVIFRIQKIEKTYQSGKAKVDLMNFKTCLRHMKDQMFFVLRKHEIARVQKNHISISI